MNTKLERILSRVERPARYVGGEYGAVYRPNSAFRVAFCFPDLYEVGMSNLGLRILYGLSNTIEGVWCERVFAPWDDMERELRAAKLPLYALESGDSVAEFDLICFSLQYELGYTNLLNMLDLAGLPVRACERKAAFPIVLCGGSGAYNAEPLAPFADAFCLGEGEEMNVEIIECLRDAKREGVSQKSEVLRRLSKIEGVYVPSLYDVSYNEDGTVSGVSARDGAPQMVKKRVVSDLDSMYFPTTPPVPSTEIIHDRVTLEVMRGCIRGCRFCQAGQIYRPVRAKSAETLTKQATASILHSGYEEISLASLSTSDYRPLALLCDNLLDFCEPRRINLSLPSLRADNFSFEIMERVRKVRKSGLTFAPEAGSQRLRDAINKNVKEEDVLRSCRIAFEGGYSTLKLYFMIGLPTETDEDVEAIAGMAYRLWKLSRECAASARGVRITVAVACFVPKPHTAFQWEKQDTKAELLRKIALLKARLPKAVAFDYHDPDFSFLEAAMARADRRVGDAIEAAWRSGARFDGWSEHFNLDRWRKAFEACGLDMDFYATRERAEHEVLPWEHLNAGVSKTHLLREKQAAYRSEITPDCRVCCSGCGASSFLENDSHCDSQPTGGQWHE